MASVTHKEGYIFRMRQRIDEDIIYISIEPDKENAGKTREFEIAFDKNGLQICTDGPQIIHPCYSNKIMIDIDLSIEIEKESE